MPDDLLDALIKFKCPKGCKILLITLIRLSGTYQETLHAVPVPFLSRCMNKERYRVLKYLNQLIEFKMLRKTKHSRFPKAMCLIINLNYNEWTYSRLPQDKSLSCLTSKDQTSSCPQTAEPHAAKTPNKAEARLRRSPEKKRIIKSSIIHKNNHFTNRTLRTNSSPDKGLIKNNQKIHKNDHSIRTPDIQTSFKIQHSAFKIHNFHDFRPRAPALEHAAAP